jgi:hypothetical protein
MTSEEFRALEREANDVIEKITKEFKKRIKELYAIAIENGHSTKFGWLEEPIEYPPHKSDFETEEEWEEADEKYEDFRDSCMGFVWADEYNFIPYDGYSFVIDDCGNVIFTSVEVLTNLKEFEFEDDVRVMFKPWLFDNWKTCVLIIAQIERELEIE